MIERIDALVEFKPADTEWWEVSRTADGFLARVWVLQRMGEPQLDFDALQKPTTTPDYIEERQDWEDLIYVLGGDIRDRMPAAEHVVVAIKYNRGRVSPEVERIVESDEERFYAWRVSRTMKGIRCRVWRVPGVEDLPYAERATVPFPEGDPEWDETVATPGEAIDFLAGKVPGDYPNHNTMLAYRARFAMMKLTDRYTVEHRDADLRSDKRRED